MDKNNIQKYKYEIKVVTDLELNKDMLEKATRLMPLTTFSDKDNEIRKNVWNYCIKNNKKYSPRLQVELFGKRRRV